MLRVPLVLQVPARALLEGDTVTLRCRGWQDNPVTGQVGTLHRGTELSLSPLQLNHSGHYRCRDLVVFWGWEQLASVAVTVQGEHPTALPEGSPLNLSCLSTPSPLRPPAPLLYRFYRDGQLVGGPQGSPQLLVPAVGVSHSGNYSCQVRFEGGTMRKSSAWLGITVRRVPPSGVSLSVQPPRGQVAMGTGPLSFSWHRGGLGTPLDTSPCLELWHTGDNDSGRNYGARSATGAAPVCVPAVPVANATITPGPLALQVRPGDPVTLRFLVQVGSSPVTFTWLHNGHQVARGPLLELGAIHVGHSGTYLCVATNQLGQEGHRVFRALSPELALEVTPQGTTGHLWNTGGVTRGSHVIPSQNSLKSMVSRCSDDEPIREQLTVCLWMMALLGDEGVFSRMSSRASFFFGVLCPQRVLFSARSPLGDFFPRHGCGEESSVRCGV
uniref:Ig-like domain-containing protein n=1 Tax=Catharus ustulatus TaxID=91951 RepID=A0A8C3UM46_CATUS